MQEAVEPAIKTVETCLDLGHLSYRRIKKNVQPFGDSAGVGQYCLVMGKCTLKETCTESSVLDYHILGIVLPAGVTYRRKQGSPPNGYMT